MFKDIKIFTLLALLIASIILPACNQDRDIPYNLTKDVEKEILKFKNQDKFGSLEKWDERGLIPSPGKVITSMESTVNNTIDNIIESKEELTVNSLKEIFKSELEKSIRLDTEEREFLAEILFELSEILKVDCKDVLMSYLY